MKKIIILLVIAPILGLLLFSCSSDDGGNSSYSSNSEKILGKWNFSRQGEIIDGEEVMVAYEGNEVGCHKDYIQFKANNELQFGDYDSEVMPCEFFIYYGYWTKNGNTIIIDDGEFEVTGEILILTTTTLKIKFDNSLILEGTKDNLAIK
jgi:lipocalin-like protein